MTPEQHRERAEALLTDVAATPVGSPVRLAWLAEAQVHALLALAAPSAVVGVLDAPEPEQIEEPRPTPPPSKSPTTRTRKTKEILQ